MNKLCPLYPLPDLRLVVETGVGHKGLVQSGAEVFEAEGVVSPEVEELWKW